MVVANITTRGIKTVKTVDSPKVRTLDETIPHCNSKLQDPDFNVRVASRSNSVDLNFPEGAVEIEQHYYTGDVVEGHYGEVDKVRYPDDVIIKEVPVYHKEIEEVVKRERVVNKIVERIPKYNYHDTYVDVEKVIEKPVYKEVPVKKIVTKEIRRPVTEERHIEKVRYIPTPEEVEVERIVDVPGDVIHQVRHVPRDEFIHRDDYFDYPVPVIVSQVIQPLLRDTNKKNRVPSKVLNPVEESFKVRIPKPVEIDYYLKGLCTELHSIDLTAEEYNSAFFQLNQHLSTSDLQKVSQYLHQDPTTGRPVKRNSHLKFYRLPGEKMDEITDYDGSIDHPSPQHKRNKNQSSFKHPYMEGTLRSPLVREGKENQTTTMAEYINSRSKIFKAEERPIQDDFNHLPDSSWSSRLVCCNNTTSPLICHDEVSIDKWPHLECRMDSLSSSPQISRSSSSKVSPCDVYTSLISQSVPSRYINPSKRSVQKPIKRSITDYYTCPPPTRKTKQNSTKEISSINKFTNFNTKCHRLVQPRKPKVPCV